MCGGVGGSVKLRFLIRRGIPEPGQSRHQTVHPLWRPNGGMRFGRRYVGGGGVLSYARPGGGGLWKVWKEIRINLESPAVKG